MNCGYTWMGRLKSRGSRNEPPDLTQISHVTHGSKSLQVFDHLQDRNLALYEEILKEARSRFEPGQRLR
jgi:hypothetical protein